jgi:hypothetical protein
MESEISITASEVYLDGDEEGFAVKIQTEAYELNVRFTKEEIEKLKLVKEARWEERGSLKIGESAGAPAFWSSDGDKVLVLVGHDDETWDFGVTLPLSTVSEMLSEIEAEQKKSTDRKPGR